jgi:hypothetical protein
VTEAILFLGALVAVAWIIWFLDWLGRRRDRKRGHA